MVGDLGGYTTKFYIKTYNGKPHIILKGHPGLRKVLTGTKYGVTHPKVITMGLGKAGGVHVAKSGGILSIVLLSAYQVADYFLTDNATLSHLIGSLATDVVKVGIATGASIAAASAVVAMGFTIAIGPIAAVVVIGVVTSMALSSLDEHYGITVSLTGFISELLLYDPVVEFDKGSMYMLGGGLGVLLFSIGGIMQGLLEKKLTPRREVLFTRGLVICLILMFGFPQLAHYVVANYARQANYNVCSGATY